MSTVSDESENLISDGVTAPFTSISSSSSVSNRPASLAQYEPLSIITNLPYYEPTIVEEYPIWPLHPSTPVSGPPESNSTHLDLEMTTISTELVSLFQADSTSPDKMEADQNIHSNTPSTSNLASSPLEGGNEKQFESNLLDTDDFANASSSKSTGAIPKIRTQKKSSSKSSKSKGYMSKQRPSRPQQMYSNAYNSVNTFPSTSSSSMIPSGSSMDLPTVGSLMAPSTSGSSITPSTLGSLVAPSTLDSLMAPSTSGSSMAPSTLGISTIPSTSGSSIYSSSKKLTYEPLLYLDTNSRRSPVPQRVQPKSNICPSTYGSQAGAFSVYKPRKMYKGIRRTIPCYESDDDNPLPRSRSPSPGCSYLPHNYRHSNDACSSSSLNDALAWPSERNPSPEIKNRSVSPLLSASSYLIRLSDSRSKQIDDKVSEDISKEMEQCKMTNGKSKGKKSRNTNSSKLLSCG